MASKGQGCIAAIYTAEWECTFAYFFFFGSAACHTAVHVRISACTKCRKCDALGMYDVLRTSVPKDVITVQEYLGEHYPFTHQVAADPPTKSRPILTWVLLDFLYLYGLISHNLPSCIMSRQLK